MVEVNLLPWREAKQHYELRMMRRTLIISISLALIFWIGCHAFLSWKLHEAGKTLQHLQSVLPIKMAAQPTDNNPIEDVGGKTLFDIMTAAAGAARSGVCYQRIAREGGGIVFAGDARSAQALTSSLQRLQNNGVFEHIKLMDFTNETARESFKFVMRARLSAISHGG